MPAGLAGDADHAALGLQDQIEGGAVAVGAVLAETGNRAVDDARIALARGLVVQAQAHQRAGAVVLEHDVGALHHAQEGLLALRVLQVEHHALLVAMQAGEIIRFPAGQGRAPGARDVAQSGGLDLDHLGAEIGEHGRTKRAGERVAQVEYLDAFQWQLHG